MTDANYSNQKKKKRKIMARNRYPGYCYCCGKYIKPGYGHFERHNGGWRIKCVKCASGRIVHDTDKEVKRIVGS